MDVKVELADQQSLSRAYEVVGGPLASPAQVDVIGAQPLVDRVNQLQATISLANASTSLREMRPLRALDETGREVTGVTLQPAQARVSVSIRRRINAQDVGVRIVTDGRPAPGYWVSGLNATPANITLQGNPEQLAEIGSYVNTLPVDVNDAVGDISLQIPLDLPPDVQAVDSDGNTAKAVAVQVKVAPRRSNLSVTRPVELVGVPSRVTATVDPSTVDLILSGPLPTLNEIEADPDLVRVTVDATVLDSGQRADLPLTVNAPDEIQVQVVPLSVEVTLP
jgi:YbbR domain-containing protein